MNFLLQTYNDMFMSIKRGAAHNGQKSNAKTFYLLAIIECIALGYLKENKFYYDDEHLRDSFNAFIRYYKAPFATDFTKPFYHLNSEPFYNLVWKDNVTLPGGSKSPSPSYLREHLSYACFDDELWSLLCVSESREVLRRGLVERYLSGSAGFQPA